MTVASHARQSFRAIFAGDECVHPASVFDPLSARIAEDIGFKAGMLGGSTASLAILGAPDIILITLSEVADLVRRICRATTLPIMVDADHGYGNALNVMRTVEELEAAGAAGLSIEDTELPRPYGLDGKNRLLSIDEGKGKIAAALEARQDPDLVVAARTDAIKFTDIDDAVRRFKEYEALGPDVLFPVGIRSFDDLDRIADATTLPILAGNLPPEMLDKEELEKRRVRLALLGHDTLPAAVQAVHDTMLALHKGTRPADLKGIASADLMNSLKRSSDYSKRTKKYLA